LDAFLRGLPKAELHIHIEGTLEPEMVFGLAERNGVTLPYPDVETLRRAYDFTDLQSFLDVYYAAAAVLIEEADFFDMTWAYLQRAAADGVIRAEIFFDPQTHTDRGIPFGTVISGISAALERAERELGMSTALIMCFLRHLPEAAAEETLDQAEPYLDRILAVGLDSSEVGFPPQLFVNVFDRAARLGLRRVAHAGEEGPPEYVRDTLDLLGAERIEHGVRALEDADLVSRLVAEGTPLTICPFSNVRLKVFERLEDHTLPRLLDAGVVVTINSDDPAYFGGYIGDNYVQTQQVLGLTRDQMVTIARNSLEATFTSGEERAALLRRLDDYLAADTAAARRSDPG
jgi:adenosine deaminase